MFSSRFVRLVISFYTLNYVNSFDNVNTLYNYYESRIHALGRNEVQNPICQLDIKQYATICTDALLSIRAENNYQYSRYPFIIINYHAFQYPEFRNMISSSNCQKKNVVYPTGETVSQWLMQCPGRPAIVPENLSLKDHVYHNLIWIYPEDENTLFLFSFLNNDNVQLLHRYHVNWGRLDLVPDQLFTMPFPRVVAADKILNEFTSSDAENIINVVTGVQFAHLCQRLSARSPFRNVVFPVWFMLSPSDEFIKPKCQLISTHIGNLMVYPCQLRSPQNLKELSEIFSIAAGSTKDSVILIIEDTIIEIIEHLSYNYLEYLI